MGLSNDDQKFRSTRIEDAIGVFVFPNHECQPQISQGSNDSYQEIRLG